ncbi:sensor histidine kinase [Frisingicoccus sp.]|uniref:sensor histidine kinase n=1 Tax=Frisingicoccus sp. TaxID=1918627 RepID=UPI002E7A4B7C|nr:ATP-binding protein [Frisingicoccus sp.]MEE0753082.1 ATP-binding protein [Frisingicoccus sp.]
MCAFIVGGIFLFYVISVKGREKERMLNMRNDLMESNYSTLQKTYAENQMLYHDYKNHMLSVRQLIKEYRREDALEYIDAYISLTAKVNRRINSGSKILDIIVNSKLGEAKAKNIDFTCDVGYVGDTGITDIDMCALVANLLDNAIEACERIEGERVWIRLKAVRRNDMLLIKLSNSIAVSDALKKDFFQSRKDKHKIHGWGMKSVEKVLKKYDGSKEHYIGEKEFEIFINIPVEEISEDKNIQLEDRK